MTGAPASDETRVVLRADLKRLRARVGRLRRSPDGTYRLIGGLTALGECLYRLADWSQARQAFEEAGVLAAELRQLQLEAEAALGLGRALRQEGAGPRAREVLTRCLALAAQARNHDVEADAHNALASLCHAEGDAAGAQKHLHQALDLRTANGSAKTVSALHNNLGILSFHSGDYLAALTHFQSALALMDMDGADRQTLLRCLNNIALLHVELGRFEEARVSYSRALALADAESDDTACAMLTVNLSDTERQLGRPEAALDLARQALALSEGLGAPEVTNAAWHALGQSLCLLGQTAQAAEALNRALDLARATKNIDGEIEALLGLSDVALAEGKARVALSSLRAALECATQSERLKLGLHCHERLAEAYERLGHDREALGHVKAARALDQRFHDEHTTRTVQNLSVQYEIDQLRREAESSAQVRDTALRAKEQAEAEVHERTRQLQRLALYDALTGLPNRVLFADRLNQAIQARRRMGRSLAVGLLDLDRFKQVNDTLGHAVGDQLLRAVAARLQESMRGEDTLARMGGDEFLLILRDADATRTQFLARRLLAAFQTPFHVGGHELFVTPSVGFALCPEHADEPDTLLGFADRAMYRAKHTGSGFALFEPEAGQPLSALSIESALNRALERDELLLHYQPQIDLSSGRMIGVEALLRWQRPGVGLVPPMSFIGLAEQTGLIIPIGAWVLREACRQARAWPGLRVAVNLSARQFSQPTLVETVRSALVSSGLDPALLELELTESMLMQSPETAAITIEQLKEIGVRVVIDDFGTGYSSLAYLKRFKLDGLKVDRSFVKDLETDPGGQNATILHAIIGLAHNLGFEVVAEGIETGAQAAFLREQGCEIGQGYHFARPVEAQAISHGRVFELAR